VGAAFDGRYVYFCPFKFGDGSHHGNVLRLDGQGSFTAASSWSAFQPGTIDGMTTRGYKGAVYDGTHVYFAPYNNGLGFNGIALRYRPGN
jgi:hypothetical protein